MWTTAENPISTASEVEPLARAPKGFGRQDEQLADEVDSERDTD